MAGLAPLIIPGAFEIGSKLLGNMGRNKKAAGLLLRVQESDLKGIQERLNAMIENEAAVDKNVLAIMSDLIGRAAFISDQAADILVGEDDV
jgi:hypothetical protein